MTMQQDYAGMFDQISSATAVVLERVASTLAGEPHPLRDGSEFDEVDFPRDLAAHENAQTEWWYYTGHCETVSGRAFGFELVFFKRRTDLDKFAVVPLRLIGNPFYFAHFAITDLTTKSFRYAHRKSANGPFDLPSTAAETHYHVNIGDWVVRQAHGVHILRASMDDITFEVSLEPKKPLVLNGTNGVSFKDQGQASRYFAYTRMAAEGDIMINGRSEHFVGSAWMDREFGTWEPTKNQKGWDWFSIQLDNGCELMCYQLRDEQGRTSSYSSGTFVDENGRAVPLSNDDFSITPKGRWISPRSGAEYPSGWAVSVPSLDLSLTVQPVLPNQELDTRGTTMIVYWEGSCSVTGRCGGGDVGGNAYVELVGYDRSHESPNLAYFLVGNPSELFGKILK